MWHNFFEKHPYLCTFILSCISGAIGATTFNLILLIAKIR